MWSNCKTRICPFHSGESPHKQHLFTRRFSWNKWNFSAELVIFFGPTMRYFLTRSR
jgi:hypothetical protein